MNIFVLVWNYLKARPLNSALNIILLSLGIAVITLLLIVNRQLEEKIAGTTRGIDLVVGAKGSPLQIILCNVFHIDFPTGNIPLAEAERISKNRLIKKAIPLALGDSYKSFRIIGTTDAYPALYKAEINTGKWHEAPMEVTIGSVVSQRLGLKPGDRFESAHGLTDGGHSHGSDYIVTGVLKPSYSVMDNLILTRVESVWEVHEEHEEGEDAHHESEAKHTAHNHHDENEPHYTLVPSVPKSDTTKEITSMLVQYRSPMGAIQLPRMINGQSSLQAASPAFEAARLFSILGTGVDILLALAWVLIIISGLSIFIALYNSLKERRYDLAILRSMGAAKTRLFLTILLEGAMLTLLGSITGLALGHLVTGLLPVFLPQLESAGLNALVFYEEEWIILVGSLLLGVLCALLPAFQAYRTDISRVLSGQ